jgi:hypothetical protein
MKKGSEGRGAPPGDDDMLPEYDFRGGERGKYAGRAFVNVRKLDADTAAAFPDSASVNRALRGLIEIAQRTAKAPGKARAPRVKRTGTA